MACSNDPNDESIECLSSFSQNSVDKSEVVMLNPYEKTAVFRADLDSFLQSHANTQKSSNPISRAKTVLSKAASWSAQKTISIESFANISYERIPEYQMFELFCNPAFPGLADIEPLADGDSVASELDSAAAHDSQSASLEDIDECSSQSMISTVGELPNIQRRNLYFVREQEQKTMETTEKQRKMSDESRHSITAKAPLYRRPSAAALESRAESLKRPGRHLGSLLVLTAGYAQVRTEWEVCREIFTLTHHVKNGLMTHTAAQELLKQMGQTREQKDSHIFMRVPDVNLETFFLMYLESTGRLPMVNDSDALCRTAFWSSTTQRSSQWLSLTDAEDILLRLLKDDLLQMAEMTTSSREDLLCALNRYGYNLILLDDIFRLLKPERKTLQYYERISEVQRKVRKACDTALSDPDLYTSSKCALYGCYDCHHIKRFCNNCFTECCGVM